METKFYHKVSHLNYIQVILVHDWQTHWLDDKHTSSKYASACFREKQLWKLYFINAPAPRPTLPASSLFARVPVYNRARESPHGPVVSAFSQLHFSPPRSFDGGHRNSTSLLSINALRPTSAVCVFAFVHACRCEFAPRLNLSTESMHRNPGALTFDPIKSDQLREGRAGSASDNLTVSFIMTDSHWRPPARPVTGLSAIWRSGKEQTTTVNRGPQSKTGQTGPFFFISYHSGTKLLQYVMCLPWKCCRSWKVIS